MYRLNLPPPWEECTNYVKSFPGGRKSWWRMLFVCHCMQLSIFFLFSQHCEMLLSRFWYLADNLRIHPLYVIFPWEKESVAENVACLLKSTNIDQNLQCQLLFSWEQEILVGWWRMQLFHHCNFLSIIPFQMNTEIYDVHKCFSSSRKQESIV